jgi:hypothetical protein
MSLRTDYLAEENQDGDVAASARAPYVAPSIADLGRLSTLFRGGSTGAQDCMSPCVPNDPGPFQ